MPIICHGQGKPQNGQGNVREKSGNFVRAHGWTPCICLASGRKVASSDASSSLWGSTAIM